MGRHVRVGSFLNPFDGEGGQIGVDAVLVMDGIFQILAAGERQFLRPKRKEGGSGQYRQDQKDFFHKSNSVLGVII